MNPDLLDLLRALSAADARFPIVDAYAVSVHAEPRATGDLDVWVDAQPDNARRVDEELRVFGAPLADLTLEDLASPGIVFQIGPPTPHRHRHVNYRRVVCRRLAWACRDHLGRRRSHPSHRSRGIDPEQA